MPDGVMRVTERPSGFADKPGRFFNADSFRWSDHDPLIIERELKACACPRQTMNGCPEKPMR